MSRLGDVDVHLFAEGTHARAYEGFGAHVARRDATPAGVLGVDFAVWAPNADSVHVIGDFESWGERPVLLERRGETGIWEGRIAGIGHGTRYKYRIVSRNGGDAVGNAPPYRFRPGGLSPARARRAQRPRDRAQAGGARAAVRLHPRRADAGRRAPVLSVVGLSGDRLLRP